MKKKIAAILLILCILASLLILYRINSVQNIEQINIIEYFPKESMVKVFDGGFENSGHVQIVDMFEHDRIQIKELNTGAGMVFVYEIQNDKVRLIYSEQVDIDLLQYNSIDLESNTNKVILEGPVEKNHVWTHEDKTMKITDINVEVTTPAGNFQAIEVTTEYSSGYTIQHYYARSIGLIMTKYDGIGSTLKFIDYEIDKYKDDEDLWEVIDENI